MIKANEFRTGNLIYEILDTAENPSFKEIFRISSINEKYSTFHDIDENITSIDSCEPIPLTEEWLLKAGFEEIKFLNEYFVQEKGYKYLDMIIRYGVFDEHRFLFDFANEKCVNLKYVHQLQNMYFALCGEELVFSTTEP